MKKLIFTLAMALFTSATVFSADYFWVGGTGNWNAADRWSTTSGGGTFYATPPTSADNVYFDANSFTAAGQIVTINVDAVCADMSWTGATNSPQLAGATTRKLSVYGSLSLVAAMNYNFLGDVYFESLSTGEPITMDGQSFKRNVYFQGIGGYTLQDAFSQTGNFTVHLVRGTLDLNDQSFTANAFNTVYTNVRTFFLRSSTVTLISGSTAFNFRGENLNLNSGSSLIRLTAANGDLNHSNGNGPGQAFYNVLFEAATGTSSASNVGGSFNNLTFNSNGQISGGSTINTVVAAGNLTINTNGTNVSTLQVGGIATINNNGTYGEITLNGNGNITGNNTIGTLILASGKSYTFNSATTQLITNGLTANGSCTTPVSMQSHNQGTQATISKSSGSIAVNWCILKDMNAAGGASFTAANTIDLGNNSGWFIIAPTANNFFEVIN